MSDLLLEWLLINTDEDCVKDTLGQISPFVNLSLTSILTLSVMALVVVSTL